MASSSAGDDINLGMYLFKFLARISLLISFMVIQFQWTLQSVISITPIIAL